MKTLSAFKVHSVIPMVLVLCCVLFLPASCQAKEKTPKDSTEAVSPKKQKEKTPLIENTKANRKVIVYYFHTSFRCHSCNKIEKFTKIAVEKGFQNELKNGLLEMKIVNVEKSGNQHFAKDYKLYTKSVVLSDTKESKELRWKNLEKVWQLLRDDEKFIKYIQNEVKEYLKGKA